MEAPVEAIGERAQVACAVFGEVERMVSAAEAGLEVAHDCVDPLELRQVPGFAPAHDDGAVLAAGVGHSGKAGQAVGKHDAAGAEAVPGPVADGFARETGHRHHLDVPRMPVGIGRDRRDERHLVLRTATGLAAGQFAAQVGIVHLDVPGQRVAGVALGHGLHQLVVEKQGGGVADAQLPHHFEGGQAGLGQADQVDRQEPDGQRQVGGLEQGAGDDGCLLPALLALVSLAGSGADHAMPRLSAAGAAETLRPALQFQRRLALRLGAEQVEKRGQRQARLELDAIHCHDTVLLDG